MHVQILNKRQTMKASLSAFYKSRSIRKTFPFKKKGISHFFHRTVPFLHTFRKMGNICSFRSKVTEKPIQTSLDSSSQILESWQMGIWILAIITGVFVLFYSKTSLGECSFWAFRGFWLISPYYKTLQMYVSCALCLSRELL